MNSELKNLSLEQREALIQRLIQRQIIDQRKDLAFFRNLTDQPAQIDTGYIGQHLISLIMGIKGGGFRGKGLDLADGAEVKSANFLDSMDKKGSVAPRWNFQANNLEAMESFLDYPAIYLVSVDQTVGERIRVRAWQVIPSLHEELKKRYIEWMEALGKPKLLDPKRPGVNFQLFPPRNKTNETYARHGNGRSNGFEPLRIELQTPPGSQLIFHAEEFINEGENKVEILHLSPNSLLV